MLRCLRHAALGWALCVGVGAVLVIPAVPNTAEARRKGKRKTNKRGADTQKRDIDKGSLAPKEEFGLDEDIGKTKSLKPAAEDKGPGLEDIEIGRARTLEDVVGDKINEEIRVAQELLQLTPGCDEGAPVRFRLADLYWEKSKRAFFKSEDFNLAEEKRNQYIALMRKLQGQTIEHYQQIIDDCPEYPDYARVLFFQGSAYMELEKSSDGVGFFKRIIQDFPNSEWVGNAWFMVGEYFFNDEDDANQALRAYKEAERHKDSQTFGYAIYKQGWCYVNTGDWDMALERFRTVVQISEDQRLNMDKRGRIGLRREGLKDFVRAYANTGDAKQAFRSLLKVGGKDDVEWMMEALGKWYINNDAHNDIITVYKELIKNYPKSTRLPLFQGRIVNAVSILDKRAVVTQSKLLTEYFEHTRQRLASGEFDKDQEAKKRVIRDIKEAEEIAENTLRGLAMEFNKDAKKLSRGTARDRTFKIAHDLYKHYLVVFPEPIPGAEVNYVFYMRFYFAEVLFELENFEEAAKNYDLVVDMDPNPPKKKEKDIVLAAAENSVHAYRELVEDLDRKNPPQISGTEAKTIPEIKSKLINACQRYIKYVGSVGDKIVEIRYLVAYIYYTYNHFSEAAPAFNDIVSNHPGHDRACFAANLTLDIYNGAKNYRALKETARTYVDNKALACGEGDRTKFAQIEERSSFTLIKVELEDNHKNLQAAKAYLEFYKQFPSSESADDAVYNAAYNYDVAQRLDKANEVREFLVNKMPNADKNLVQETLFNIAASYERIVDFERAAHYLELYVQKYPDDKKSKDVLFNAGLYRATLHDFSGSRRNRDQFIRKYKDDKELVQQVSSSICESFEKEAELFEAGESDQRAVVKKWEEVNDCYFKYSKTYEGKDDDGVCHAQFRRGEIMRTKTKYAKGYAEQAKFLVKNWPTWKRRNKMEDLPRCAAAVAEIELRDLTPELKKYKELQISEVNPSEKGMAKFKASTKAKIDARDALIKKYQDVAAYGEVVSAAEWALAALYYIGESYLNSVKVLLDAPIVQKVQGVKVPEEIKAELTAQLKDQSLPIEESAVEAYRVCVNTANRLGVYTQWSVKALKRLQELRPEEFPPADERLVEVKFVDALTVATNDIVISDGDSWKPLGAVVAADGMKPGDKKKEDPKKEPKVDKDDGGEEKTDKDTKAAKGQRGRKRGRAR